MSECHHAASLQVNPSTAHGGLPRCLLAAMGAPQLVLDLVSCEDGSGWRDSEISAAADRWSQGSGGCANPRWIGGCGESNRPGQRWSCLLPCAWLPWPSR